MPERVAVKTLLHSLAHDMEFVCVAMRLHRHLEVTVNMDPTSANSNVCRQAVNPLLVACVALHVLVDKTAVIQFHS